jgi:hypothetical protein
MLQPEGEAYWMVAYEHQNLALNNFCKKNHVGYKSFTDDGYLPVTHYRGVVKVDGQEHDLNGKLYECVKDGQYYVNADEDGRQFSSKGERHFAPLLIQKRGDKKMIARPYKARFIDPRLRPVDPSPYQVSVPKAEPARGARRFLDPSAGRRP